MFKYNKLKKSVYTLVLRKTIVFKKASEYYKPHFMDYQVDKYTN